MKAIRYRRFGPPEVLEWIEAPDPVARAGEVLVQVAAASLNPKDCLVRKGKFRWLSGRRFPRACGYDFAGTVVSAAPPFAPGEEVFGMLNGWAGGTHAERVAVPLDEVAPRPQVPSIEDCASLPLVGLTALQALRDLGRVCPGASVLVNGASGGVGTIAVQIARALGGRVTAVCSARNHAFVAGLGAEVFDYAATDLGALSGSFDMIFDAFGNQTFSALRHRLRPGGTYVATVPRLAATARHVLSHVRPGRKAWLVQVRSNAADLRALARLVDDGLVYPVVDRRLPMSDSVEAHRYLETKRARGKVILLPSPD